MLPAITLFPTLLLIGLLSPVIKVSSKCALPFVICGILVKKSEILENAEKIDTIVFDKTGTLTYGNLKIAGIFNYSKLEDSKVLKLVGSIEAKSTHPISKAFVDYLKEISNTIVSIFSAFSNISLFFTNIPLVAHIPSLTTIASGVANP